MSSYSAMLFLEVAPSNLRELDIQIQKSLKPFNGRKWARPQFICPSGWVFDWVEFESESDVNFITMDSHGRIDLIRNQKSVFGDLTASQRKEVGISAALDSMHLTTYFETGSIGDDLASQIVREGVVLFPDGSYLDRGEFSFFDAYDLSQIKIRQVMRSMLEDRWQQAILELLSTSGSALVLLTFRERPY